jgi:hypothetical protein
LADVFAYRITWAEGLLTVASDRPIVVERDRMLERLKLPDRLYQEAAGLDTSLKESGGLLQLFDGDRHVGLQADRVITDDQPLIEYPLLADQWVGYRP